MMRQFLLILVGLLIAGCASLPVSVTEVLAKPAHSETGFLLVAPDRGGMGNDRVRQIFKELPKIHHAQLVFITDQDSAKYVDQALGWLKDKGVKRLVVLPLFLSTANPKFDLLSDFLSNKKQTIQFQYARAFGDSYLAVEMLADQLNRIKKSDIVIIAGYGADGAQNRTAMTRDLNQIVLNARQGVFTDEIKTVVWPVRGSQDYAGINQQAWEQVRKSQGRVQLIPFHMGRELDSMMSFNAELGFGLSDNMKLLSPGDDETKWMSMWLQREVNRYTAIVRDSVGIVFNAHGASFHWNQTMRDATRELAAQYPVEYAFSMGDPPSLRNAVKRLEDRGVGAIVIVRVFGMESSFRRSIEHLVGRDIETPSDDMSMATHHNGHGDMGMGYAPRLNTTSIVVTAGGLQDDSLFAQALLDRAKAISTEPTKETVIVVAHGQGGDQMNEAWLTLLASLTAQMKQNGGEEFRDILYQTWREDWPDKSVSRITSVKDMVMAARKDGGIALVIPARTTGSGPADEFLKGLNYRAGTGFAPHPLFSKWVEKQFDKGIAMIRQSQGQTLPPDNKKPETEIINEK